MKIRGCLVTALLALPCLLATAGCGSTGSAGSPSAGPSDVPEANTVSAAKGFATAWVHALNQATVTGKTAQLLALSGPHCAVCTDFAHHLKSIYSAGGHVQTKGWQVKNVIPIAGQSLKHPGFQVTVISAPQKVYSSKSAKPQTYSGGQQGMRMFLMRAHHKWLVSKIEIAQGS